MPPLPAAAMDLQRNRVRPVIRRPRPHTRVRRLLHIRLPQPNIRVHNLRRMEASAADIRGHLRDQSRTTSRRPVGPILDLLQDINPLHQALIMVNRQECQRMAGISNRLDMPLRGLDPDIGVVMFFGIDLLG